MESGDRRRSTQSGNRNLIKLRGLSNLELHEIVCADYSQDDPHRRREGFAGGVVHDVRIGEVVAAASGLKLASAGGEDVFDPLTLAAISEGNGESAGRAEDVYRSVINLARFSADVSDDPEAGQPSGESAGDPVGDRKIEARQPLLAEAHEQHAG